MTKSTTYFESGQKHDTYKFTVGKYGKVLIKRDGRPWRTVVFEKQSGRTLMKPSES